MDEKARSLMIWTQMINTYGKKFVGDRLEKSGNISQVAKSWLSATEEFSDFQVRSGLSYLYETYTADTPVVTPNEFGEILRSIIDKETNSNTSINTRIADNQVKKLAASRASIAEYNMSIAGNNQQFYIASAFIAAALFFSTGMIAWTYIL